MEQALVDVNPEMLRWARESVRLTIDEAAKALGLRDTRRWSASGRLEALEKGAVQPTEAELVRIIKLYRWPELTYSLDEPPESTEIANFRKVPAGVVSDREEGWLQSLIVDMSARQSMLRGILEDDADESPRDFIGSVQLGDGVESTARAASTVRELLGAQDQHLALREVARTSESLLAHLRESMGKLGIFTLLARDLGNYHTKLRVDLFRGIALADEYAPFIIVNANDAKVAQSFTLLHEFVHLLIGENGVSGGSLVETTRTFAVERFCNDVASEVLLPRECLLDRAATVSTADLDIDGVVRGVCQAWCVSPSLVAYRLWRERLIEAESYQRLVAGSRNFLAEQPTDNKSTAENSGGPSYYVVKRHDLGFALVEVVQRLVDVGELTYTKAATVLGVRNGIVGRLLSSHRQHRRYRLQENVTNA